MLSMVTIAGRAGGGAVHSIMSRHIDRHELRERLLPSWLSYLPLRTTNLAPNFLKIAGFATA
jgi:hypothetical protein